MSFMWFIYVAGIMDSAKEIIATLSVLSLLAVVFVTVVSFIFAANLAPYGTEGKAIKKAWTNQRALRYPLVLFAFLGLAINALLPSKETMYYMAAAYGAEKVVTSEKAGELATESFGLLEDYIAKYRKELNESK